MDLLVIPTSCVNDCEAHCCPRERGNREVRLVLDLTVNEAKRLATTEKPVVINPSGGYFMPKGCSALDGKFCRLHNTLDQPATCRENLVGGSFCMAVRREIARRREKK
ncbi:hypothetical protein KBC75_04825 [Candidatus Shapirobacteria bacterium]|nr:hypothetical protein [Candidatus Shapirobacteria bacterium]